MSKKSKKNIFFVKDIKANPKFITNDINTLRQHYNLYLHNVKITKNLYIIIALINQFFSILIKIFKIDVFYIWFADYHSFIPVLFSKVFNKKSIICAGGYEATYIPEINCGVLTNNGLKKRIRKFCAVYSLKNCNCILPVDESLIAHDNKYIYSERSSPEIFKDGIRNLIPGIKTKMRTVHLGYDPDYFKKPNYIEKEQIILSAGLIINDDELKRKGFDLLIDASKILTEYKFILVGFDRDYIKKFSDLNISNLKLESIIPYDKLIYYYNISKVFAQISMFEGMPSTICEAMLCECVPVGSNVNAIPDIIGDTGFIVQRRNISDVIDNLRMALSSPLRTGERARLRIKEHFPLKKRENEIIKIIDNL